jgi:hypothetical protein
METWFLYETFSVVFLVHLLLELSQELPIFIAVGFVLIPRPVFVSPWIIIKEQVLCEMNRPVEQKRMQHVERVEKHIDLLLR